MSVHKINAIQGDKKGAVQYYVRLFIDERYARFYFSWIFAFTRKTAYFTLK
ncbi:hypothetical protein HC725_14340 [Vibrio sp. S17_S38]|uniref:hypothetical protein n=1 Tax=Vibrio sp. S17_S38 TaxID=2720229 RepID=UPI0016804796|nr:hypothetical protein [Vibrio sp. S17_S38]MBD1574439.1 hypothetical protein [Vibrio sp. S17_S38]